MSENTIKTMPLKAVSATDAKEKFLAGPPKKDAKVKAERPSVKKLSDTSSRFAKIMTFGGYGTGKTFGICDLITEHDLKVLGISTDVGGDGLSSVYAELQDRDRADLLDTHVFHITLESYDDFVEFTKDPTKFWPEIYDAGIDVLMWDGFSGFQQYQIAEYVDGLPEVYDKEGNQITLKYWGEIRKATVANLNRFLYMHNKKTGQLWHKYVTCLDNDVARDEELRQTTDENARRKLRKDTKAPFVQGAAAKLIGPAFDIVFHARKKQEKKDDGTKVTKFVYDTEPSDRMKAKARGLNLPPIIDANMGVVWKMLIERTGIPVKSIGKVAA